MPHTHEHSTDPDLSDLLDLDAAVLHEYFDAALDWVRATAGDAVPSQVLDLGAGTGTASIALAQRFPAADVVAVDLEARSLARLTTRAHDLGLDGRIRTVTADLDADWPDLGTLDVTWASMSLHHLADPGAALRAVRAATRPGGLIAVAEFRETMRFLRADPEGSRPGFEARIAETLDAAHREQLPTLGSQWAPRLADAGWHMIATRDFVVDLDPPQHPEASRYARAWFTRLSAGMAEHLDPDDRAILASLVDGEALLRPGSLHIRGIRAVTLGTR
jgi:SAM-dependent methyltransferase